MEHTMNTNNSPTKEDKFIQKTCVFLLQLSLLYGKETREIRVKRCNENRRCSCRQLQHLFVDGFMALQCSNISRKRGRVIL